jgi:hypothetical protein
MRFRFRHAVAVATMALLWGVCACAQVHAATGVRELPAAPEGVSTAGTDYTLRTVPFGGTSVTLIDVHGGLGDWTRPTVADLSPLPSSTPPGKDTVQWFYGGIATWMAVPVGWRLQRASIGADANARYTFVAPEGAASGWITYSVIPACEECLLQEAEGLLPNAGEQLASRHDAPPVLLGQTNPVMSWQSRPDDCTALFRYRANGLTVHAAVLSSVPVSALETGKGDLALADVYAALPASKSALADFMVNGFRQTFHACQSPEGWKE